MLSGNQARDLGDGLRRLRQRKRLTRYQAANVCGLPHLLYARLEQGWMPGEVEEEALMRAWGELQVFRQASVQTGAQTRPRAGTRAEPLRMGCPSSRGIPRR